MADSKGTEGKVSLQLESNNYKLFIYLLVLNKTSMYVWAISNKKLHICDHLELRS